MYDDADLEAPANGAVAGGYVNCDQDCTAATRIYVQERVYDTFMQSFLGKVKQIRVGNPSNKSTDMGPLISDRQRDRVEGYVERALHAGANILVGGKRAPVAGLEKGFFFEPTVIAERPFPNLSRPQKAHRPNIGQAAYKQACLLGIFSLLPQMSKVC